MSCRCLKWQTHGLLRMCGVIVIAFKTDRRKCSKHGIELFDADFAKLNINGFTCDPHDLYKVLRPFKPDSHNNLIKRFETFSRCGKA